MIIISVLAIIVAYVFYFNVYYRGYYGFDFYIYGILKFEYLVMEVSIEILMKLSYNISYI